MEYSESYQHTRDIDWFFRSGERFIHVASNGGELPYFANSIEQLRMIQAQVALHNNVDGLEVIINEQYVGERIAAIANNYWQNGYEEVTLEQVRGNYLSSFIAMAQKGFYSYDRVPGSNAYILICSPKQPISIEIQIPAADDQIRFEREDKSVFFIELYY